MSPISNWDTFGPVFTNGPESFWTAFFLVVAVLMFVAFFVRMIMHENKSYAETVAKARVEGAPPPPDVG